MITIVIADDHDLMRESVASLLCGVPGFNIVSQCENGRQLVKAVETFRPNVAVVDVSMPELNGIDAARQIRKVSPTTRIIALSVYNDEAYIRDMIDAGISGYVVKSGATKDLIEAVRNGSKGKIFFSEEIADVAGKIQKTAGSRKSASSITEHQLTQREREILQLIGEGHTSVEIASRLCISKTTVKHHRDNLMDKLDVRNVAGLTRQAIRLKILQIE
jgi:DNA-binding NarL/FixJ family response regulator